MTAVERLVAALDAAGCRPRQGESAGKWSARCPAHDDSSPSLSIGSIEGQALLYCHTGCDTADVMAALGLGMADLFDNRHGREYRYSDGRIVHRYYDAGRKRFRQSGNTKPDGKAALYRLEQIRHAVAEGKPVLVVEGEKDVHAAESLGLTATCSPQGAGKALRADWSPLAGGHVLIVADGDDPGRQHAAQVLNLLVALGADAAVFAVKVGKDLADHVAAGYGINDLAPLELPQAAPVGRRITLTRASSIVPKPVVWTWETVDESTGEQHGRFPAGSLCINVGRAGLGKSQFACWMTAHLTRGTLPGVHYGTPRCVVYAASEDSWAMTIVPRLIAAGADLDRVFRIEVEDDGEPHARLTLPVDTAALGDAILRNDVAMLVCDPLLSLIDAGVNDYRARELRAALEPLVAMADATGCLIHALAHFTKATGSDPLMLISGSGAFGQLIRAGIGFARDDSTEDDTGAVVLSTIKNNLGREDLPSLTCSIEPVQVETPTGLAHVSRFVLGGPSDRSVRDILRGPDDGDERTERDEAADWLTKYLTDQGGEAPAKDVIKAARADGIAERTLKRARQRAGITSERRGFGQGSVWTLDPSFVPHSGHSGHVQERGTNGPNDGLNGDPSAQDSPQCTGCGAPLLLATPGRTLCEACRLHPEGTP